MILALPDRLHLRVGDDTVSMRLVLRSGVFLVQARAYLGDECLRVNQGAGDCQSDCCLN